MIQIAVIIVLAVVGLMIVKWIMNKRSQEQEGDPELEDAPDEMT
jgi:flagellar basal body-associated protein FliL